MQSYIHHQKDKKQVNNNKPKNHPFSRQKSNISFNSAPFLKILIFQNSKKKKTNSTRSLYLIPFVHKFLCKTKNGKKNKAKRIIIHFMLKIPHTRKSQTKTTKKRKKKKEKAKTKNFTVFFFLFPVRLKSMLSLEKSDESESLERGFEYGVPSPPIT